MCTDIIQQLCGRRSALHTLVPLTGESKVTTWMPRVSTVQLARNKNDCCSDYIAALACPKVVWSLRYQCAVACWIYTCKLVVGGYEGTLGPLVPPLRQVDQRCTVVHSRRAISRASWDDLIACGVLDHLLQPRQVSAAGMPTGEVSAL